MDNATIVLASARAIRHKQLSLEEETLFLPNYIRMNEFISKLCIVSGYVTIDEDTRTLLLLEASDFENFSKLQIERNFFTFTKNSSYIFKFFSELSAEMYEIDNLLGADVYGEYEEHIEILMELYKRYEALCKEKKILDKIYLPKLYSFNEEYAQSHTKIVVEVDGYLTNFEYMLLEKLTKYTKLECIFTASRFNKKMQSKFQGLVFCEGVKYTISMNDMKILKEQKIDTNKNVSCESFSESLLQIAFIQQKVYEFIQKGYQAQNIAVVLPNEASAEVLRSFDNKNNFNFAMGESFAKTGIYLALYAAVKAIDEKSQESYARLNRVGDSVYAVLLPIYNSINTEVNILDILESFKELIVAKNEMKIYLKVLYEFKNILNSMQEMSVKSILNIFMSRLAAQTIDDVRGGKITVMGVLETRGIEFDAVVIIDFDDKNVPKRSDKDMFLNTSIRENANLPTMIDRENLQKHYYEMLINSSQEVAISYVASEQSNGSRFLKQLSIKENKIYAEDDYASLVFEKKQINSTRDDEIIQAYSFEGIKLSNSRLKTYLSCKRKYYYAYVKKIKGHDIPRDMPQEHEIGTAVHDALKNLYLSKNRYDNLELLKKDLAEQLELQKGKSELDKYLIALQKKKMDQFCEMEIQRFCDGWEVLYCEKSFEIDFEGMTLQGQIDRIDKKENLIKVLDYKTGTYKIYNKNSFVDAKDFQLEFYYLLASGLGNVSCAFYDLKNNKIVPEDFLEEKIEILKTHIQDLQNITEIDFVKCEDTKECSYCEYALMCGR
jgi:RecB family exonuclease